MWYSTLLLGLYVSLLKQLAEAHESHMIRFHNYTDKQILDYLLDPVRYDFRHRPEEQTQVNVSVLLLTLSSPDESSLKYEIEFLLHQRWEDGRLRFMDDDSRKGHLNGLLHQDKVWKPDIYFLKHGEFKTPLTPIHMSLRLYPNGTVVYTLRRHMTLVCQGNLKIFPFDNPKCPFAVESMSHEESQLKIDWSPTEPSINTATSMRSHNAYLAKNETGYCDKRHTWRGNYSCLRVLLVFTRDKTFYISTVFVPGIVLVTSSFISFWLDINAVPARVMIGVTTMLNFCTTTNSFRSTLPVVSGLTAMNLWDGVCMFFIYASMLEFIIVNYLYRNLGRGGAQRQPPGSRPSSAGGTAEPRIPLLSRQHRAQDFEMIRKPHDYNTLVTSRSDVSGLLLEDVIKGPVSEQGTNHKASSLGGRQEHDVNSLVRPVSASAGLAGLGSTAAPGAGSKEATTGIELGATATNDPEESDAAAATGLNNTGLENERLRAVASVFAWLRRPQLFPSELPPKPRIAKAIDYFSRTVFPVFFGIFTFGFFLAYAYIGPRAEENWKLIEA
ncbi:glutamate-gated chloride channel-like isoform X2 [Ornithodoros turicata]|uniref:glutamate-gated chloride channel-like isoform X2 n=1 Tax=Ornithodoros turicata TaxID=34597 RepID=UPI0031396D90